jgi:hypothetical protein
MLHQGAMNPLSAVSLQYGNTYCAAQLPAHALATPGPQPGRTWPRAGATGAWHKAASFSVHQEFALPVTLCAESQYGGNHAACATIIS